MLQELEIGMTSLGRTAGLFVRWGELGQCNTVAFFGQVFPSGILLRDLYSLNFPSTAPQQDSQGEGADLCFVSMS